MTDPVRFQDKTALITGAASGIGLATARRLRAEGAGRLVLCDLDAAALDEAGAAIGGDLSLHAGDVGDEGLWDAIEPGLGRLDLAVVNAGIGSSGEIAGLRLADWRRTMHVNLDGAFLTLRAAMRAIADGGAIVVTASAAGLKAEPGISAYAASKAGAIQLAKVAAKEGAKRGVRVNAIAPSGVETAIWSGMDFFRDLAAKLGGEDAAYKAMAGASTPLGRYAKADEIAAQIAFLLSADAATITGSVLLTDGGYTL